MEPIFYLAYSIAFLSLLCLIASSLMFVFGYEKLYPIISYFGFFLLFNLLIELIAKLMLYLNYAHDIDCNNLPLLHLYTLGEFLLISMFYYFIIKHRMTLGNFFKMFIFIISILIIINSAFFQSIYGFNSYAKTPVQFIIIIYSIIYFLLVDSKLSKRNLKQKTILWINTAILIYYSGSLFVFMFSDFFLRYGEGLHEGFWIFNAILNLFFQVIILKSIWTALKNKKYISSL